jgi:hypothetical protein
MTIKAKSDDHAAQTAPELPGLSLLRSELEALAVIMPGLISGMAPVMPGHVPPTEAEVEEGFDNMPV